MPPLETNPATGKHVTVLGAAGFIGRFVVDELLRSGWRVRAFVRPAELCPFSARREIEIVRGDVRDSTAVTQALAGAFAAINLAGAKSDETESEAVNVGGARNLVAAARAHGGTRIVHFSTQAVKIAEQGIYARTKLAADRVVESSGLPFTILRPSVVYGPGFSGVFSTLQRAIERLPIVPVLGDGRWQSAPVYVTDVAHAVAACLATPATIGRAYDLGGPEMIAFDDLLDRIAAHCGRRRRKIHLPYPLALAAARAAARILPRPPISVSNVLGSNQKIPIDLGPAQRDFGFQPMPLAEGLRRMLDAPEDANVLADEAQRFAHYLLDAELEADLRERYIAAARRLFAGLPDRDVRFVRRHPWALSWVDAATAVFRPHAQLRQRLLLITALMEASPRHAEFFLAAPPRPASLVLRLAGWATLSAAKALAGLLLLPFIRSVDAARR